MGIIDVLDLLVNYGFPIACCGVMFGVILYMEKRHKAERYEVENRYKNERAEIEQRHKKEIDKLNETVEKTRTTIENNTKAMTELSTIVKVFLNYHD